MRLFGHPLHAILSDFPVALLGTSLVWDVLGLLRHEELWWAISFWCLALGLAFALITAIAGFIDYATMKASDAAVKTATCHMMIMLCAVSLYGVSLFIRRTAAAPAGKHLIAALALEGSGLLLLSAGGWFGGHLVFHHGIGRDPQ